MAILVETASNPKLSEFRLRDRVILKSHFPKPVKEGISNIAGIRTHPLDVRTGCDEGKFSRSGFLAPSEYQQGNLAGTHQRDKVRLGGNCDAAGLENGRVQMYVPCVGSMLYYTLST